MGAVTASDGNSYHLWGLPINSTQQIVDVRKFATIDIPLGDGYRAGLLTGASDGRREWKLTLSTLIGADIWNNAITDVNGSSVSREQYVRALYMQNKATGTPFVLTDPQSGVNYFTDFADDRLTMKRMVVKLYSTGLVLRQRRLVGVTLP